jgi:hypothetical protein
MILKRSTREGFVHNATIYLSSDLYISELVQLGQHDNVLQTNCELKPTTIKLLLAILINVCSESLLLAKSFLLPRRSCNQGPASNKLLSKY